MNLKETLSQVNKRKKIKYLCKNRRCVILLSQIQFSENVGRKRTGFISLNSNNLAAVAAVKIKFVKKHEKRKRDKGAEESAYF